MCYTLIIYLKFSQYPNHFKIPSLYNNRFYLFIKKIYVPQKNNNNMLRIGEERTIYHRVGESSFWGTAPCQTTSYRGASRRWHAYHTNFIILLYSYYIPACCCAVASHNLMVGIL